jgi:pyruvate dehydrogenase E1 component alpha subunit
MMAELYGKATGNAKGRGGSMHMFLDHMLGGFGIVSNQISVAAGAAFSAKYRGTKEIAVCFLGDGAMAQGTFHETLNLSSLWELPCLFVVENNQWGMGTHVSRAVANYQQFSTLIAKAFNIPSYRLDGMDFLNCYGGFREAAEKVRTSGRPVLCECIGERFKGHSISDPGLYRTKEALRASQERDPILLLKKTLIAKGLLTEADYEAIDKACREKVIASMKFADESPYPDPKTLGTCVYIEEGA